MGQPIDIDIQWGGFYASRDQSTGSVSIYRLLDFNRDAYHAAPYKEKFPEIPSLNDVVRLSPFVGHVPIDTQDLAKPSTQLIGGIPLTATDLEGYMIFLEHHGASSEERTELQARLIEFSNEPPLSLRLEVVDGELQIFERP